MTLFFQILDLMLLFFFPNDYCYPNDIITDVRWPR